MDYEAQCRLIVESFLAKGINFLALDFDQTLISIHTYSEWRGEVSDLIPFIRPIFYTLIPMCIRQGILIAIVTLSSEVYMISTLIQRAFNIQIPIRGSDHSWTYVGMGSREGKQSHIASAVEELSAAHTHLRITRKSTILLDDDVNNITAAHSNGVRAVLYQPENEARTIENLMNCDEFFT